MDWRAWVADSWHWLLLCLLLAEVGHKLVGVNRKLRDVGIQWEKSYAAWSHPRVSPSVVG